MTGFALDGWPLLAVLLIVAVVCLLLGAALGYFTAATDLERERKAARDEGFQSGIETAWDLIGSDARRVASVAFGERFSSPVALFDQDAPTEAARAIELRGDD